LPTLAKQFKRSRTEELENSYVFNAPDVVNGINLSSFESLVPEVCEKTLYRDLQDLVKKAF